MITSPPCSLNRCFPYSRVVVMCLMRENNLIPSCQVSVTHLTYKIGIFDLKFAANCHLGALSCRLLWVFTVIPILFDLFTVVVCNMEKGTQASSSNSVKDVVEKRRKAPLVSIQKDMMIEYMTSHPNLQSGKFTNEFTFKKAQKLWEDITEKLNSVAGGANKEWRQWRKTWQDLKKNTKSKVSKSRQHVRKTGGGEPTDVSLTPTDLKMLDIIPTASVEGLMEVEESPIGFDLDETDGETNVITDVEIAVDVEVPDDPKENAEPDHTYYLSHPNIPSASSSTFKATPKKLSKTRRLESSLKLSQQLIEGLERKSDVLENYYQNKETYLQHRINYEKNKLNTMEKQNMLLENIDRSLSVLVRNKDLLK